METNLFSLDEENKKLMARLSEVEAKLEAILKSNFVGVTFWNADRKITAANDAFLKTMDRQLKGLIRKPLKATVYALCDATRPMPSPLEKSH